MIDYIFPSNRKGQIECKRGKVLSNKRWNETRVTGDQYGVRSRVTDRGEVWLRYDDGTEGMIKTVIPVTEGQDLIVGFGKIAPEKGNISHFIYWENMNSNERGIEASLGARFFFTPGAAFTLWLRPFLLSVVIAVFVWFCVDSTAGGMYPGVPAFISAMIAFIVSLFVTYIMTFKGAKKTIEKSEKKMIDDFEKLGSSLYSRSK